MCFYADSRSQSDGIFLEVPHFASELETLNLIGHIQIFSDKPAIALQEITVIRRIFATSKV